MNGRWREKNKAADGCAIVMRVTNGEKGEDVRNKVLYTTAVLALLTGTMAIAQVPGSVAGTYDRSVGGPINRSFNTGIGSNGGGGGGSRAETHASGSSWAPTKNAAAAEAGVAKSSSGMARAGEREQGSSGETAMNAGGPKPEGAKRSGPKKLGVPASTSSATASSFGGSFGSQAPMFGLSHGFTGGGGGSSHQSKKAEEEKIGRDMASQSGSGGRRGRGHGGKRVLPKLRPRIESKGEQNCDQASKLQLCTWL